MRREMRLNAGRAAMMAAIIGALAFAAPVWAQAASTAGDQLSPDQLARIEMTIINSPPTPPQGIERPLAKPSVGLATKTLVVPTSTWTYGCTATSAGMLFAYYDRNGYPNMYTGPANGGVCPLTNVGQGDTPGAPIAGACSIIATENGFDGRITRGHVEDYWISYEFGGPDPWEGMWTQHTWGGCTADYLGTNQWKWDYDLNTYKETNTDGSTVYFSYTGSGDKLFNYIPDAAFGLPQTEACHGLRLFAESRGYTVVENYTQRIDTQVTGGFSFANYKAEIDANCPVMIHVTNHTMVGVGYDDANNTVFLNDTWDNSMHSMSWGGSYAGLAMQCVSIIHLAPAAGTITVTSPNGGEYWNLGSSHAITWTSTNVTGNVTVQLYNNWTKVRTLATVAASAGTWTWAVPAGETPLTTYRIRVQSVTNTAISDYSNNIFTVGAPPSLTVISPNGGELWCRGYKYSVKWTATGALSNVNVQLYNNWTRIRTLATVSAASGSWTWTIPVDEALLTTYRMRVQTADGAVSDYGDATFAISSNVPTLTLTSPNGGQAWYAGSRQTVTWNSTGLTGNNVNILLYNNWTSLGVIGTAPAQNGSWTWNIPAGQTLLSTYRIRVQSQLNTSISDYGDGLFSIVANPLPGSWVFIYNWAKGLAYWEISADGTYTDSQGASGTWVLSGADSVTLTYGCTDCAVYTGKLVGSYKDGMTGTMTTPYGGSGTWEATKDFPQ